MRIAQWLYDDAGRTDSYRVFDAANRVDWVQLYNDAGLLTQRVEYDDANRTDRIAVFDTAGRTDAQWL